MNGGPDCQSCAGMLNSASSHIRASSDKLPKQRPASLAVGEGKKKESNSHHWRQECLSMHAGVAFSLWGRRAALPSFAARVAIFFIEAPYSCGIPPSASLVLKQVDIPAARRALGVKQEGPVDGPRMLESSYTSLWSLSLRGEVVLGLCNKCIWMSF